MAKSISQVAGRQRESGHLINDGKSRASPAFQVQKVGEMGLSGSYLLEAECRGFQSLLALRPSA